MYFAHPIDLFAFPILKKKKQRIYQVWFLFGMSPGLILIRTVLEQSINNKMVSKI